MKKRVLFVSLGCPKNQVDGEMMLATLEDAGFEIAEDFVHPFFGKTVESLFDAIEEPEAVCLYGTRF